LTIDLKQSEGLQRGLGEFKIAGIFNLRNIPYEGVHQWS